MGNRVMTLNASASKALRQRVVQHIHAVTLQGWNMCRLL